MIIDWGSIFHSSKGLSRTISCNYQILAGTIVGFPEAQSQRLTGTWGKLFV